MNALQLRKEGKKAGKRDDADVKNERRRHREAMRLGVRADAKTPQGSNAVGRQGGWIVAIAATFMP